MPSTLSPPSVPSTEDLAAAPEAPPLAGAAGFCSLNRINMQIKLAPQSIEALAYIISGGSNSDARVIGIYRSGPKIEQFMRTCGVFMSVGSGSRYTR
jgi:hypothetical protein